MNRLSALPRWRHVRWLVAAALVPTLWACGARKLVAPVGGPSQVIKNRFQQSVNRDLDMLFLIDDSQSMAPLQQKMRDQMPTFMNRLAALPGGLPNLHVAVVSSSLGAGIYGNVNGCAPGTIGNLNGAFQHNATCTALPPTEHFLKSEGGANNFTGNIADVFNCIANLGANGCGFEHQFEATRLALQRSQNPGDADNAGFLRAGAYLAVIMLTNEDDCSVPADSMLFDPNQQHLSDPLGGLQSYRCNEFGHKCEPMNPPHTVGMMDVTLQNCVSAEDGKLVTVDGFVKFLQSLKPGNPNQILVAAITGSPDTYTVTPHMFTLGDGTMEVQPQMAHSCTQATAMGGMPEYADPGVRIKQFIDAFGNNGTLQSICAPNYMQAMDRIATVIGRALGVQCIQQNLQTKPNGDPDCDVTQRQTVNGVATDTLVPHCDPGRPGADAAHPCWEFQPAANCPAGAQLLAVCYDAGCTPGSKPMTQTDALVSCAIMP